MLLDKNLFRVGRELRAFHSEIAAEAAALASEHWYLWPDQGAYSAGWYVFPLLFDEIPPDYHPDFALHRSLCPRTWAVFSRFPEIVTGGFSRLLPGCHIFPHCDVVQPDVYRYHLGLQMNGACGMRSTRDQIECGVGVDYVIDHRQQHESANLGDMPRDVLLVDFRASPAELAALAAWRQQSAAAGG